MAVETEYFDKKQMPCNQLQKGAEQADRMAGQLDKQGKDAETVIGVCPQCGIHMIRQILEDGNVVYMPGRGWPEKCTELYPVIKKGSKRWT